MTEREQFELDEMRRQIYKERGYSCEYCGLPADFYGTPQLAHLVPQRKAVVALYSKKLIHHIDNVKLVCSLECNGKVEMPQREWAAHMKRIQARIKGKA